MEWIRCDGSKIVSDSKGEILGEVFIATCSGSSYGEQYRNRVFLGWSYDSGYGSAEFAGDIFAVARCDFPKFPEGIFDE